MMKEGWVYKKLGSVTKVVSGSTPKTNIKEYWGGSNKWVTPAELNDRMFILDTKRTITDKAVLHTNLNLLPVGTVLLSSRAPIGKVAIVGTPMYCNQGFKNLICSDLLYNLFLYWFLKGKKNYLNSLGRGATFKEISKNIVESILIPLPELSEQKKVVNELEKLNEILTKKYEQLKELDRLGQAVFYDMFGDPILNDRKWKSCNLSQICDVGSSKRVFVEDLVEKGIPFYRGTEIAVLSLGDKIIPKFYITEEHYNRLKELTGTPVYGDLLLPSICHEGKIWRVNTNEPFYFKDGRVLWIHLNSKDVNGTYLQYMLREKIMKDYINIASGTTFSELKIFALKKVVVILPPIDLQMKFAEQINAIESQKQKIKQSIVEVQQLLDYTMNKYFG